MKNRSLLIILGIITVIAGFFAILNPVAGSIAVTLLTGWLFLLIGILQIVATFRETDWSHRLWSLLLAVLAILAGISLLANPLAGVISLTYLLAILFVVSGDFKIVASHQESLHSHDAVSVLVRGVEGGFQPDLVAGQPALGHGDK